MSSPKVWSRFSTTRKSDGKVYNFCVQEATENEKDDVLNFLAKNSIPVENFLRSAGIYKSGEATKEMLGLYDMMYDKAHVTICYEDKESTENPIIGVNLIVLEKKGVEDLLPKIISLVKTPEMLKIMNILKVTNELYDELKTSGFEQYYSGKGLFVRPDFSSMGIATELLKLRLVICKKHGVPATGAWMTATGSQRAAERAGWTTAYEIPFDELGRLSGCEFIGAPPACKLMVAYIDK